MPTPSTLTTGDFIESIKGIGTRDMPLAFAALLLRGEPNSTVDVTVLRRKPEPQKLTLTRAVIKIQSVKYKLIEPGYAYFRVTQFQEHTGETLAAAIQNLYKQNQGAMRDRIAHSLENRRTFGGRLT